jgi:hypothetical protein
MRSDIVRRRDGFSIHASQLASKPFGEWGQYFGYGVIGVKFPSFSKCSNPEETRRIHTIVTMTFCSELSAVPFQGALLLEEAKERAQSAFK